MQKRLGLDLNIADDFGHWLAGFVDGEGCFLAFIERRPDDRPHLRTSFQITLRADDEPILQIIKKTLGIGRIFKLKASPGDISPNPTVRYAVKRTGDAYHVLLPFFERYPLRAKKLEDFHIWKQIVVIKYLEGRPQGPTRLSESFWAKVIPLVNQLRDGRKFKP